MNRILISFLAVLAMSGQVRAQAQALDDQEVVDIEGLYKTQASPVKIQVQEAAIEPAPSATESAPAEATVIDEKTATNNAAKEKLKEEKVERLTDLNKLAPFREVSVIQKKYLPKTERAQIYLGGGMTTNSPWFLNLGVKLNIAYHFTESFGMELGGLFLSNSERQVAQEIRDKNGLQPEKFVNTKPCS